MIFHNGAREVEFHPFDESQDDDHNSILLVEISNVFAVQRDLFIGTAPFEIFFDWMLS